MEIKITEFYNNANTLDYSNSIADSGLNDIGTITWDNAKKSNYVFRLTLADRKAFLTYLENAGMENAFENTMNETRALLIQMISGDIQEKEAVCSTWNEYNELSEAGRVSGRLCNRDNDIYYIID